MPEVGGLNHRYERRAAKTNLRCNSIRIGFCPGAAPLTIAAAAPGGARKAASSDDGAGRVESKDAVSKSPRAHEFRPITPKDEAFENDSLAYSSLRELSEA